MKSYATLSHKVKVLTNEAIRRQVVQMWCKSQVNNHRRGAQQKQVFSLTLSFSTLLVHLAKMKIPVNQSISRDFWYPEPGSNRHGHCCPQDFKSGVSTDSTIRAHQKSRKIDRIASKQHRKNRQKSNPVFQAAANTTVARQQNEPPKIVKIERCAKFTGNNHHFLPVGSPPRPSFQ